MGTRLALGLGAALLALVATGGSNVRASPSIVWFAGHDAPAWSPAGNQIAFTAFQGGHQGEIYVMRPDGTGKHDLTRNPAYDDHAAWSPDATKIAFTSNRTGRDDIYVMKADGTQQRRVTESGFDYEPSWSPDGSKIVFWSRRDGNSEIYTMNADGTNQTRLTDNPDSDYSPNWGPDGRILFVTNRDIGGRTTIYVMNSDGTDQHQLTGPSVDWSESRPVWSPDGRRIAFTSSHDFPVDNTEIYVMNADGTGETRLTHSPQRDDWPTWSPDGTKLAFSHGVLLKPEIYKMNVDGSGLRLLSLKRPVFETKFLLIPTAVAGARLTVTLGITTGTGATVPHAHESCVASVDGKGVPVVAHSFKVSRARCAWLIPRSAHGKWLELRIGARFGASAVSETAKTLIR